MHGSPVIMADIGDGKPGLRGSLSGLEIFFDLDEAAAGIEVSRNAIRAEAAYSRVTRLLSGINAGDLGLATHQICAAPFCNGGRAGIVFAARLGRCGQAVGDNPAPGHDNNDASYADQKTHFDHLVTR